MCLEGATAVCIVIPTPARSVPSPLATYSINSHETTQGVPPATVAEFTLSGNGNLDYYDGTFSSPLSIPAQRGVKTPR